MQPRTRKLAIPAVLPYSAAPNFVIDTVRRAKDPDRKMFGLRKSFMIWAYLNALLCMFMTVLLFRQVMSGFGWILDYVVPLSCFLQLLAGIALFKIPVRVPFAAVCVLVFYAYAIFNGILINRDIGRTLFLTMGWQTSHLVDYLMVGLGVMQAVYCGPEVRKWIKNTIIVFFGFSGLVGLMQLANIGWALNTFKTPVEMSIFRPVGTTDYPSQLGFEGFAGIMLFGAPIINRNLKWQEWLGVLFFALVILGAQYRTMYYAGLVVALTPILYLQFRRNKNLGVAFSVVVLASITIPLLLFPKKFEYGLRPAANDPALMARQLAWQQLEPILETRPMTGIGPDPNLMLSSGLMKVDKWSHTVLDNYYITVYACFGYIGLLIVGITFLTIAGGCILRAASNSPAAREWSFIAIVSTVSILALSLTGNSLVYPPVGFFYALILGLGAATWKEELDANMVGDTIIALRKVMRKPLRLLGVNV
ncbi:MAG: O-antigen ligase family protein [Armatimonadota bacterium]